MADTRLAPHRTLVAPLNVGVVGATGNVGRTMLRVLAERAVPIAQLRVFASERSEGTELVSGEHHAVVERLDAADPTDLDVALFSAGADRAIKHAPRFAAAGAIVVDNSSAFRQAVDVPLVVPEVNAEDAARAPRGIIANPNCSTIQLVAALAPIAARVGLEHVHVTTMQAVSGTGRDAMAELDTQAAAVLADKPVNAAVYPHQIAFNVLPHCDTFAEDGSTREERKLVRETRKILHLPELAIFATCTRVAVYNAHSEVVHFATRDPLSPDECRALLAGAPGIRVLDDPAHLQYPMPIIADGRDEVLVGRIRRDDSRANGLAMFICADNLRKGAATNAVQIVEALLARS